MYDCLMWAEGRSDDLVLPNLSDKMHKYDILILTPGGFLSGATKPIKGLEDKLSEAIFERRNVENHTTSIRFIIFLQNQNQLDFVL